MNKAQATSLLDADKRAKGIVDHEFTQDVIDICEPQIQATIQRVIKGETTFEEQEALLLAEWNALHTTTGH
jgi:hypothetical protein